MEKNRGRATRFWFIYTVNVWVWVLSCGLVGQEALTAPEEDGVIAEQPTTLVGRHVGWHLGSETERGPHHQVMESVHEFLTDEGERYATTNTFTVLATGMFYQEDGLWLRSEESFTRAADGFSALKGPHEVRLPATLSDPNAVEMVSAEGDRFRSRVLGLSYYEPTSGKSVIISELEDVSGEITKSNEVSYRACFTDGIDGDLVYVYRQGSFAQDILLRSKELPDPKDFGMESQEIYLEIVTEFLEAPKPTGERSEISHGVTDDRLSFGSYLMPSGSAFWTEGAKIQGDGPRMFKRWEQVDQRTILFESVRLPELMALLDTLPESASTQDIQRANRVASATRILPKGVVREGRKYAQARKSSAKAVVLDYELAQTQTNMTLRCGTTFLVQDTVNLAETTTIEGGVVVKYTNTLSAMIICNGPVLCKTGPYMPAIFTADADHTVGEPLTNVNSNLSTNFYANPALKIMSSGQDLHDLRFSHARIGIFFYDFSAGSNSNQLRHCQFQRCATAIQCNGYGSTYQNLLVRNALVYNSRYAFYGYSFCVRAEHLTVDQVTRLAYDYSNQQYATPCTLWMTNCLLEAVGTPQNVTRYETCCQWSSSSATFNPIGGGAHYLPSTSPYLGMGTTGIDANLARELATKTVTAPTLYVGQTNIPPVALDKVYSLGYHYDPIDVAVNAYVITNSTVTLKAGTSVAVYGDRGFVIEAGGALEASGSPTQPVRLFPHTAVQEVSTNWGNAGVYGKELITGPMRNTSGSQAGGYASLRFAQLFGLGGAGYLIKTENNWQLISGTYLRDCQLRGCPSIFAGPAALSTTNGNVGLTNNLFYRANTRMYGYAPCMVFNNLFFKGTNDIATGVDSAFYANIFHESAITNTYPTRIWHGYNGYVGTGQTHLLGNSPLGGDVPTTGGLSSFTYATSILGDFYQVSTNFSDAAGYPTLANSGLVQYTTRTNQSKESGTLLDIGFHYIACANNIPSDQDSDGLADYVEDKDGDGSNDIDETSPTNPDTDGDSISDGIEVLDGTLGTNVDDRRLTSLVPAGLGYWRFDTSEWRGEQNQLPLNVSTSPAPTLAQSFDGNALCVTNNGQFLTYRMVETNDNYRVNLNCEVGTIRFMYKPNWTSQTYEGTGPGSLSTLIEVGRTNDATKQGWMALWIDAAGDNLRFQSRSGSGTWSSSFAWPIYMDEGKWYDVMVRFSTNRLRIDFDNTGANDTNLTTDLVLPRIGNVSGAAFSLGNSFDGLHPMKGQMDELQILNYMLDSECVPYDGINVQGAESSLTNGYAFRQPILTATVSTNQSTVNLQWNNTFQHAENALKLERRDLSTSVWTTLFSSNTVWHYTDSNVQVGHSYEYRLSVPAKPDWNYRRAACKVGSEVQDPARKLILLVDSTVASSLEAEIAQLIADVSKENWTVIRTNVPRHINITTNNIPNITNIYYIHTVVSNAYYQTPYLPETTALYILGHVAIPMSGLNNPDGHGQRVMPADAYYADVDGIWLDTVDYGSTNRAFGLSTWLDINPIPGFNNTTGDGRFDPMFIPSEAEMGIGRVDFADLYVTNSIYTHLQSTGDVMTARSPADETEAVLLKRYLRKVHAFRSSPPQGRLTAQAYADYGGDNYPNQHVSYNNALMTWSAVGGSDLGSLTKGAFVSNGQKAVLWGFLGGGGYAYHGIGTYDNTNYSRYSSTVFPPFGWQDQGVWHDTLLGSSGRTNSSNFTNNWTIRWQDTNQVWHTNFMYAGRTEETKAYFMTVRASYCVEWHQPNAYLRTLLTGFQYGLAVNWLEDVQAWRFESLGLNEPLATGVRATLNTRSRRVDNDGLPRSDSASAYDALDTDQDRLAPVFTVLLGDPTLRLKS